MTWMEIITHELFIQFLTGFAGALTMAIIDFRTKARLTKHILVGGLTSMFATPIFAPGLVKLFSNFMEPSQDKQAATYIVGAFSIYLFEAIRDFFKARKQ